MKVNYEVALDIQGARLERIIKRMYIIILFLIVSLIGTNLGWLYYERQFETCETTTIKAEQEANGNSNNYIIGGDYAREAEGDNNQDSNERAQDRR